MSTRPPTNDSARISLLRTALASSQRDEAAGRIYLTPATRDALADQAARLEAAAQAVAQAAAEQQQALAGVDLALAELQAQARRSWQTLRWRVRWQSVSPAVLPYYQLRPGHTPQALNRAAWLELAEQLILGDASAVEAGFDSAIDPVALPAARDALQEALGRLNGCKERLHTLRVQARNVRSGSDRLISHLIGDLRHALRDRSPGDQQQIMRTYGLRFRRAGEETTPRNLLPASGTAVVGWQLQAQTVESPAPVAAG